MSASTPNTGAEFIHVAVGVLRDRSGRILIARRPDHVHQGGLWEFPGGKCEAGETAGAALRRELWEELGIRVITAFPLIRVRHRYADRSVLLEVFEVNAFQGQPHGREDQPLAWVRPEQLDQYAFPEADRPILNTLTLPPWYAILEGAGDSEPYRRRFHALLDRGLRLIYWRARDLPPPAYQRLAAEFLIAARSQAATLMLRSDSFESPTDGAGLHLSSVQLHCLDRRPSGWHRVAAACHCQEDLIQAARLELDFAILSPVKPTLTHPDVRPIGMETASRWIAQVDVPVYVMGGMSRDDLVKARARGAWGIAGIRLFTV